MIATGVRENGEREMLGFALGASEEEGFWLDFLQPDAAGIERGAIGDQRRSSRPEPVCGFADEVPQQYSQSFALIHSQIPRQQPPAPGCAAPAARKLSARRCAPGWSSKPVRASPKWRRQTLPG